MSTRKGVTVARLYRFNDKELDAVLKVLRTEMTYETYADIFGLAQASAASHRITALLRSALTQKKLTFRRSKGI